MSCASSSSHMLIHQSLTKCLRRATFRSATPSSALPTVGITVEHVAKSSALPMRALPLTCGILRRTLARNPEAALRADGQATMPQMISLPNPVRTRLSIRCFVLCRQVNCLRKREPSSPRVYARTATTRSGILIVSHHVNAHDVPNRERATVMAILIATVRRLIRASPSPKADLLPLLNF